VCLITTSLSFVTTAGNILVIVAFHANRRLQTITNYFILSLAYADMVIGLVSMNLFTIYIVQGEWRLGPLVCDIWLCIDYVASNASVMNLLIISVDRYLALTKPLTYRAKRTKRRACLMIVGAWMVSFVLWVPSILLWPLVEGGRNVHNKKCSIRFIVASPAVAIGTAMAAFYVPVLVMSALSWCIHRVNIEHNKYANTFRIQDKPSERNARRYLVSNPMHPIRHVDHTKQLTQKQGLTTNRKTNKNLNYDFKWHNTEQLYNIIHYLVTNNIIMHILYIQIGENGVKWLNHRMSTNLTNTSKETHDLSPSDKQTSLTVIQVDKQIPGNSPPQQDQTDGTVQLAAKESKTSFRLSETTTTLLNATKQNVRSFSARENKAARMLLCIMIVFIITWAPYNILVVISTICGEDGCVNDVLWKLSYWLCYINSTINPACYALCSPEFRNTFLRILRCQKSGKLFRPRNGLTP
uniref:G-protein coupled receptors family 1 profile domain-containing protein n=1 Tax=Ciona savignyi TaxID=51511 RepID=H2Y8R9_CIOSA